MPTRIFSCKVYLKEREEAPDALKKKSTCTVSVKAPSLISNRPALISRHILTAANTDSVRSVRGTSADLKHAGERALDVKWRQIRVTRCSNPAAITVTVTVLFTWIQLWMCCRSSVMKSPETQLVSARFTSPAVKRKLTRFGFLYILILCFFF